VGASTGIGRATASRLHGLGARVVVSARSHECALDAFVAEHPGSEAMPLDATDRDAMRAAAAQHRGHARPHRPGHLLRRHLQRRCAPPSSTWTWRCAMCRSTRSARCTAGRAAAADAGAGPGRPGGLAAPQPGVQRGRLPRLPQSLAYGPTKAALINLAENLYLDLQPLGMGVSLINPGFVETPLTAQNDFKHAGADHPEEAAAQIVRGWARGDFEIHFPKRFTLWLKGLRLLGYGAYFAAVRRSTGL
jgi:NAD(P)-dependent dehydrogenase (short-subunit alcohol dehydrogenase family)